MSNPTFSIILPSHNGENRIRHAVASVHEQTFRDWELIIVLDFCTDDTMKDAENEFVDDLDTLREKVHFVMTDCRNDGLARNAGLDAATGDWILFLDDDDWFLYETCFEQLASQISRNNEDVLMYSFVITKGEYFRQSPERYYTGICGHVWRREFIGSERFAGIPYGSDSDFMQRMMQKKPRVVFWDMPMYRYNYMREGSLSWQKANGGDGNR